METICNIFPANALPLIDEGRIVKVAGLVLVRQRPGTAKGICFMTIEDETGVANLVVFEKLFDEYRKEILQSRLIMVEGKLQKEGEVIHVIVRKCYDVSKLLRKLLLLTANILLCKHSPALMKKVFLSHPTRRQPRLRFFSILRWR